MNCQWTESTALVFLVTSLVMFAGGYFARWLVVWLREKELDELTKGMSPAGREYYKNEYRKHKHL